MACYAKQPHVRAKHNEWKLQNRDKVIASWRRQHEKDKKNKRHRKSMLMRNFGLTEIEYQQMFDAQGGLCAICARSWKTRMLAVDHDHETGKIRGLLCGRCNGQLGWLENNEWINAAKAYLARY
jgi:hypothetical protein